MVSFSLNNISEKHKILLFGISVSVITWCFYLLIFLPQKQQQDAWVAKCNVERQRIQVIETYMLAHPNTEEYVTELNYNLEYIGEILPDNGNVRTFLVQMEQAAQESSVQLEHVKPTTPVCKSGYSEFNLEVKIKGNFFQTLNYLKRLEGSGRLATISEISMKVQNNVLESTMIVTIYSYGTSLSQNSKQS